MSDFARSVATQEEAAAPLLVALRRIIGVALVRVPGTADTWKCQFCMGPAIPGMKALVHESECPVTIAREGLAEWRSENR